MKISRTNKLAFTDNMSSVVLDDQTVHGLFEEQVTKTPNKTALIFEGSSISYSELNAKANCVAVYLVKEGIKPNDRVAFLSEKSLDMAVCIIGILKAGASFLNLDLNYPEQRLNYIAQNSGIKFLLTKAKYKNRINVKLDKILFEDIVFCSGCHNPNVNGAEACAIIYTSGSTGNPKGVEASHIRTVNGIINKREICDISASTSTILLTPYSASMFLLAFFSYICSGSELLILGDDKVKDIRYIIHCIKKYKINCMNSVPAICEVVMANIDASDGKLLKTWMLSGDRISEKLIETVKRKFPNFEIINGWGCSEGGFLTTCRHLENEDVITVGSAVDNVRIYILDDNLNIVKKNVSGTIYISCIGMEESYLNDVEKSDQAFISNPFIEGEKIYCTGDVGIMHDNGNLQLIGRSDDQIKIRGFRVELSAIESRLCLLPGIKNVVAIARSENNNNKVLCCYFTGKKFKLEELRQWLSLSLPDYMIPSYFIHLKQIPYNMNGKVDRNALPDITESIALGTEYVAPETDKELVICNVWQKIFSKEKVGINDNFFNLGGDSIKAINIISQLQGNFIVGITDIYKNPTIKSLAENIDFQEGNLHLKFNKIKKVIHDSDRKRAEYAKLIRPIVDNYNLKNSKYNSIDLSKIKAYKNILVTGGTGFLGCHIIKELLETVKSNITLLIRGKDKKTASERFLKKCSYYFGSKYSNCLNENSRITVYSGDLEDCKFGLSYKDYKDLSHSIDCIIHTAASVKHYGEYDFFYAANVKTTANLLMFAKKCIKKDFHYISSEAICLFGEYSDNRPYTVFSEYEMDQNQSLGSKPYIKSKLEGEKLVIAARGDGIKTNIYRAGNLVVNSETGKAQQNINENAFFTKMKAYQNIGFVPEKIVTKDLSYINDTAKLFIELFNKVNLQNELFHVSNFKSDNLSDILSSKEMNLGIKKISADEFIDLIEKNYTNENIKEDINNLMLHNGWLDENKKVKTEFFVLSEKTNMIADRLGFKWSDFQCNKFRKMLLNN
jgi:amino acid adenylation domain-containing protein/thioester reductase-like protein